MYLPSSFGPPTSGLPSSGFLVIPSPPSKRTDFHFLCQSLSGNNLRPEKYRALADKFLFRLRSLLLHRAHSHIIGEPLPPTLTFRCEGDQRMGFTKACIYFSKCMALWSRWSGERNWHLRPIHSLSLSSLWIEDVWVCMLEPDLSTPSWGNWEGGHIAGGKWQSRVRRKRSVM